VSGLFFPSENLRPNKVPFSDGERLKAVGKDQKLVFPFFGRIVGWRFSKGSASNLGGGTNAIRKSEEKDYIS